MKKRAPLLPPLLFAASVTAVVGCNDFFTKDVVLGGKGATDGETGSGTPQPDDDNDGLSNSVEGAFQMESRRADSDSDGFGDGLEFVSENGDPLNSERSPKVGERAKTLSPAEVKTGERDGDQDGLGDSFEIENSLEEANPDTDEDGYNDGLELVSGSNPFVASDRPKRSAPPAAGGSGSSIVAPSDTDSDGLSDTIESQLGSSSTSVDSDGDGFSDGIEYLMGSDSDNERSVPNFQVPTPPTTTVTSTTETTSTTLGAS